MKKNKIFKITGLLLTIVWMIASLGIFSLTVSAAEGDKVSVTIGGETTYYTSIKDAVAKANESGNATITLLQDTTTGERLDITKSTTLDLNGNTLSCVTNFDDIYDTMVAVTANGAKLTIIDSIGGGKLDGTGTTFVLYLGDPSWQGSVTFTSSAQISGGTVSGGVRMRGGTSMTVSGGTLENNTDGLATIEMQSETTLNVSGGEILNTAFAGDAISNMNGGTVIISGGTVNASGDYARAIRTQNSGGVEISGGNIFGAQYDLSFGSDDTVELTGGTFPGGITVYGKTLNESLGNGFSYWAVVGGQNTMLTVATDATGITDKGDITIRATCNHSGNTNDYTDNNDGTHSFTCTVCQTAVTEAHTLTDGACNACDYVCPHGNFDSTSGICGDCQASVAIAKVETGSTTIYYLTAGELQTAVENNSAAQTVTLLADIEIVAFRFRASGTKNTLDLNGHTLTGSEPNAVLIVAASCELTITGTGSINFADLILMAANGEGAKIVVGSDVTLNGILRNLDGGILDLTDATIPEGGLTVKLQVGDMPDNVSDVLLLPADYYFFVNGVAVYSFSTTTEGTVLKHTDHSYIYTDNGDGTHDAACTACGAEVDNEAHSGGKATCTMQAVCENCGTSYGNIDENAHAWNEGVVTTDPTCSAVGVKTFICTHNSVHTKTEGVAIDENAHDFTDATCTAPKICKVCNATEGETLEHSYDNDCDTACNTCGAERTVGDHADTDENELCDMCNAEVPKDGLSGGAIAGIVCGSTATVGIGGFVFIWFVIKKKKWSDLAAVFKNK